MSIFIGSGLTQGDYGINIVHGLLRYYRLGLQAIKASLIITSLLCVIKSDRISSLLQKAWPVDVNGRYN